MTGSAGGTPFPDPATLAEGLGRLPPGFAEIAKIIRPAGDADLLAAATATAVPPSGPAKPASSPLPDLSSGEVRTRDQAMRVVVAIERLLDADELDAAEELFGEHLDWGDALLRLPAATLGQHVSLAFVRYLEQGPPSLGPLIGADFWFRAGLHSGNLGDIDTARDYLHTAIRAYEAMGHTRGQAVALITLSEFLLRHGLMSQAGDAVASAVALATTARERDNRADSEVQFATATRGWCEFLSGDVRLAEALLVDADVRELNSVGAHMTEIDAYYWGQHLRATGRAAAARRLVQLCLDAGRSNPWNNNEARHLMLLARLNLDAGEDGAPAADSAVRMFRDGDYLAELPEALTLAAEVRRRSGDQDGADAHIEEALAIAEPRGLVPVQAAAFATRARIVHSRAAADAALELARDLPWHELDALEAHADIDRAAGGDRGFAERAASLRRRLIPPGLYPDPLAVAERTHSAQRSTH